MLELILIVLAVFSVVAALVAVGTKTKSVAILSAAMVGLIVSVMFLVLAAPDVAMTEASIGSGLTTFIFFFALRKVRDIQND